MALLRAGIIGLGQVGSRFDEDPKRVGVWSHAAAYAQVPGVLLAAGADPDQEARSKFSARRGVSRLYTDYREMLRAEQLDVVSVCTPTLLHEEAVMAAADAGVKAIFCEKPIAATVEAGRRIVERCEKQGIVLAVNHTRRWDRNYRWPLELVKQGFLGKLQHVVGYYSGGIFNIGTHLLDVMRMYGGNVDWVVGEWVGDRNTPDPTVAGMLRFSEGTTAKLLGFGNPSDLIFELDLVGDEGRIRILENGRRVETYRFAESRNYSGYREFTAVELSNSLPEEDRFVAAVKDLVRCVQNGGRPACSGRDGLAAVESATALCHSAAAGSVKQSLGVRVR